MEKRKPTFSKWRRVGWLFSGTRTGQWRGERRHLLALALYELCDVDPLHPPHPKTYLHPLSPPTPSTALRPAPSTRCSPERPPAGARSVQPASRPSARPSAVDSLPQLQAPSSTRPVRPRASSMPAETLPALRRLWLSYPRLVPASSHCLV